MCGIAGELRFDGQEPDRAAIERASARLAARGPDSHGEHRAGNALLAHRRLKIIDISDRSNQPMVSEELGLAIVFNGAIYNFRELRRELESLGHRFHSDGDTEVILRGFAQWGARVVERLNGMFAFAIHERDTGRTTLARDRLGIKPLYFTSAPGRLRFASSLPALLAAGDVDTAIDPVALHHYMSFHAIVPAPRTILRGVRRLAPATILEVEPDGETRTTRYWELTFPPHRAPTDERALVEELRDRLRTAVRRRMIADVPVGVLLSGGIDSSLIVGLLAEGGASDLRTFSIGFESVGDEQGDEFRYSDVVVDRFGTDHTKIRVSGIELLETLDAVFRAMSEPMVSHDNVGFFLLSQEVAKHVKVVQSGQGADEVFAGYHWYQTVMGAPPERAAAVYREAFLDRDHERMRTILHDAWLDEDHSGAFVERHFSAPGATEPIDKALRLDTTVMLVDDPVKRVDNHTMAFGLEARVPFLDHELVEFAARVPGALKVVGGGKGILKSAARGIVPNEVIDRPKGYFPVPALTYLRGDYLERVKDLVLGERCRRRGLFREAWVEELVAAPASHITPLRGSELWQIASLEWWLEAHGL